MFSLQSPSRDSHYDDKTTNSFHSTPVLSSIGSPGRHSWNSSSTHYSESLRPGSRKGSARLHPCKRENEFDAIEEEGISGDDNRNGIPRRCYFLSFIAEFLFLCPCFVWAATNIYRK
ncbi:hypothetical protein R6Q57_015708 [Mikania cordata]